MANKMRMSIDARVLYQMYEYAAFAKAVYGSEIAGYGHYREKDGIYKLAPLTKQIVTGGDVDAFPSAIINDVKYDISDMVVQWHSHVEMSTFFSGVDQRNIKDMLKLYPLLISIVVNVKQEYTARLDIRNIAYGKHTMRLPESEIVSFDLELVPYYSSDAVYNEVKEKLRRPRKKYVRTKIIQLPANNKPVNEDDEKYEGEDDYNSWWDDDMWNSVLNDITAPEETPTFNEWYKEVMMMAGSLCRNHENEFRYTRIEQTGTVFINHNTSHTFCTIEANSIQVSGRHSSWTAFLMLCGGDYHKNYAINEPNKARVQQELEEIIAKRMLAQTASQAGDKK